MAYLRRSQLVAMNQHYRRFSLDYFLDCQQKVGFQNIELWCGASHFWIDSKGFEPVEPLKRKLRERNLRVVSVTTPSCAYQYQYAAQETKPLEESYRYFCNGIRVAAELGADRVVVNSGWGYIHEDHEEMWKRSRDNLFRLAEFAETQGIVCVMESMRKDETNLVNSLETAKKMYREINHPNMKVMVDSIATGAAGESLEQWFDAFGKDLIHMHFLDGDPYLHNVWGDGNTPLERQLQVMNDRGFSGYLVQEVADEKYFSNPLQADIKNMRTLERFIEE